MNKILIVALIVLQTIGFSFTHGLETSVDYEDTIAVDIITGDGTVNNPYRIYDVHQLQAISENSHAHYTLADDIDATETKNWNDGKGFEPLENFKGTFDGMSYTITGLYINIPDADNVGLFSFIGVNGVVNNLTLIDVNISGNKKSVGAIAGHNKGTVTNILVSGYVSGDWRVGGLVGHNQNGDVLNNTFNGSVNGKSSVGGLVGYNEIGSIYTSSSDGFVNGSGLVGGLVGFNSQGSTVSKSYSFANITGSSYIGGLIGENRLSEIQYSFAKGDVVGNNIVGGLIGTNYIGTVKNSYSTGNINGIEGVGGLVGSNGGRIFNSFSSGNVSGTENVGGLVGINANLVENSYSTGNVKGNDTTGGLVGRNSRRIYNSYSKSDVIGDENIGGLVGTNILASSYRSYATGNSSGTRFVGGLVGYNRESTISNSYSLGGVQGFDYIGGLVGWNRGGSVNKSYSKGVVIAEENFGGLIGVGSTSSTTDSFWDIESSGQSISYGGMGKTTEEMMNITTFFDAGWNITAILNESRQNSHYKWNIVNLETYPLLTQEPPEINITYPEYGEEIGVRYVFVTWESYEGRYPISHYEIRLNDGSWENIGLETQHRFTDLEDGNHTVRVKVVDQAGHNATDLVNFYVEEIVYQQDDINDIFMDLEWKIFALILVSIIVVLNILIIKNSSKKS